MEESAKALILAEALEAVEGGEDVEVVLDRYPALRGILSPTVEMALRLRDARDSVQMPPFPAESLRKRLRAAGAI